MFALSVIVLGVAVFATSLTAVIGPVVGRSLQRIVNRKGSRMKRENHFVVIGNTPLAINTWRELAKRGRPVTRILRETPEEGENKDVDVVVGDPSMTETLREAGAHHAEAVLAMLADDSENAFAVLAVKELGGPAKTVAAVNDARHLSRVKLVQPDVVIAPQVLGGELAAMLLSGEQVTPEFVMQRVFQQVNPTAGQTGNRKAVLILVRHTGNIFSRSRLGTATCRWTAAVRNSRLALVQARLRARLRTGTNSSDIQPADRSGSYQSRPTRMPASYRAEVELRHFRLQKMRSHYSRRNPQAFFH